MITNKEKILYKDLSYEIIGLAMQVHRAQALNYLIATGKRLAMILNFAGKKLEYERLAF
jgi:hypothetical protein